MRSQTLVKRYAQGLISSAKDKKEFESLCAELIKSDDFLSSHPKLRETLISPLLPTSKKAVATVKVFVPGSCIKKGRDRASDLERDFPRR